MPHDLDDLDRLSQAIDTLSRGAPPLTFDERQILATYARRALRVERGIAKYDIHLLRGSNGQFFACSYANLPKRCGAELQAYGADAFAAVETLLDKLEETTCPRT